MLKLKLIKNILSKIDNLKNIAEIGVFEGKLTKKILDAVPEIQTYYCVDPWKHYKEWDNSLLSKTWKEVDFNKVFDNFKNNIKKHEDKIIIYKMTSEEASKKIEDKGLDFVFIDGNHDYEYVKKDIEIWKNKVKTGGFLSGHDYHEKYGVKKAVDELIPNTKIHKKSKIWYKEIKE